MSSLGATTYVLRYADRARDEVSLLRIDSMIDAAVIDITPNVEYYDANKVVSLKDKKNYCGNRCRRNRGSRAALQMAKTSYGV